jgi:uncharacterized membrane protein YdjX (TVP38/TMEM64 family)
MSQYVNDALAWMEGLEPASASLALLLVTIVLTVSTVLPTTPCNFAAGLISGGLLPGSVVFATGCTLGSVINFYLGRSCLYAWAQRQLRDSPTLVALESALSERAARMVVLVRLSPVFPFAVVGHVLGATNMDAFTFSWATFVGVLPGCFLYCWIGMSMRDLVASGGSDSGGGDGNSSVSSIISIGVGVLSTVLVSWQAKRIFDEGVSALPARVVCTVWCNLTERNCIT